MGRFAIDIQSKNQFPTWEEVKQQSRQVYLLRLMKTAAGNVTAASRIAKKDRGEIYRYLRRYQIDPKRYKPGALTRPKFTLKHQEHFLL